MAKTRDLQNLIKKAAEIHAGGRYSSAEKWYLRALKLAPQNSQLLFSIATLYEDSGKPAKAAQFYAKTLQSSPDNFAAAYNLGGCLQDAGQTDAAESAFRNAIVLQPRSHLSHFGLGNLLARAGRLDDAIEAFQTVCQLEPGFADGWFNLANMLNTKQRYPDAIAAYGKAIDCRPEFAEALVNLGTLQQGLGEFQEARHSFERALNIDPDLPAAHYQLSLMGQAQGDISDGVEQIELSLNRWAGAQPGRSTLHFAAARLCAKLKRYDEAFEHYRSANDICASRAAFSPTRFAGYIDRLIEAYDAAAFKRFTNWGNQSTVPVFIVGMPRSGTTLVEQVIAAHPDMQAGGERPDIVQFVRQVAAPDRLGELEMSTIARFTEDYLRDSSDDAEAARRMTDKLPANFLNLGLVRLMFPNAKIVHCRRDPLDTCLSCYFQNFSDSLPFTNDLNWLGCYFQEYQRLMRHWETVLPMQVHEVVYEEFVADFSVEARKLIAHMDVEWDERCLDITSSDRVITTASVWQARQPVYGSSVGAWRNYERHLGPLKNALGMHASSESAASPGQQ